MTATGYVSTTGDARKVAKAGDTMTGELVLPDSSPDTALAAASKGYVDGVATSTGLDTGIIFGGELNANLANPLAVDISATIGFIADYVTTPATPVITRVEIPAQTVALTDTSRVLTWWMANSAGAIIQQGTRPTNTQRRTHLQLGATAQTGGAIFVDQTLPVILPQPTNQLYDLLYALGSFNIDGDTLTAAGANLQVAKSAGTVFATGFNHFAGSTLTNDPHVSSTPAQNPTSMRYVTRTPAPAVSTVTSVDVANYDNAGVITAIGGGGNSATIQRVYLFPVNATADQVVVQYGQTVYSSLAEAVAAVGSDSFVQNPTISDGVLLGFIVATRSATNLSNTAQARIIMAAKFGSGPSASSEALSLFALLSGAAFTGDVTVNGANLTVKRADNTGAYRFRVTGSGLDLEVAGLDVFISKWANADFTGAQSNVMRWEAAGPHLIGRVQFGTGAFDDVHDIDSGTGVAALGAKNGLANVRLCGRKATTGAPTTGTWITGDVVLDSAGAWHLCTTGGTPGVWT